MKQTSSKSRYAEFERKIKHEAEIAATTQKPENDWVFGNVEAIGSTTVAQNLGEDTSAAVACNLTEDTNAAAAKVKAERTEVMSRSQEI